MTEADLYIYVKRWIEATRPFVQSSSLFVSHHKTLITADIDWIDGGSWMRPDLALFHTHRRRFDPCPRLDLYTFEVKLSAVGALQGLHQTLAHARIGDFVLLVLPMSDAIGPEVVAQAERFGVGLVTFVDPERWDTYCIHVSPRRGTPDCDLRDQFIGAALDAAGAAGEILRWLGLTAGGPQ